MGYQNGEAVGLPRCRDCIFMQGASVWGVACKLLSYRGLEVAFQKCHFWHAKVALLGGESGTFRSQKGNFWKVKVQLVYLYSVSVCLCRFAGGVLLAAEKEFHHLFHDFHFEDFHDSDVESAGDEDAGDEQQHHVPDGAGDEIGCCHDGECDEEERGDVAQYVAQTQPDESVSHDLPYAQPCDVESGIGDDHHQDAVVVEGDDDGDEDEDVEGGAPQVDV